MILSTRNVAKWNQQSHKQKETGCGVGDIHVGVQFGRAGWACYKLMKQI